MSSVGIVERLCALEKAWEGIEFRLTSLEAMGVQATSVGTQGPTLARVDSIVSSMFQEEDVAREEGVREGSFHKKRSAQSFHLNCLMFQETKHPIDSSAWEVLLLVGTRGVGWAASCMIVVSALLNVFLQVIFALVCLNGLTQRTDTEQLKEQMRQWRLGAAHSGNFMDAIQWRSLVSRVCEVDQSLVLSTSQVFLVQSIGQYRTPFRFMVRDAWQFLLSGWPFDNDKRLASTPLIQHCEVTVGRMLTLVVVVAWTLLILKELYAVFDYMTSILGVPSGLTSIEVEDRKFAICKLSRRRKSVAVIFCAVRVVVAWIIYVAGLQWLANTVVVEDLILNAIALAFILELDEIIFVTVVPRIVQVMVENLEPLPRGAHRNFGGLCSRSVFAVAAISTAVFTVFAKYTNTMESHMRSLHFEMCAGNRDFVVDFNAELNMVVVANTTAGKAPFIDLKPEEGCSEAQSIKQVPLHNIDMAVVDQFQSLDFSSMQHQELKGWFMRDRAAFLEASARSRSDMEETFCSDFIDSNRFPRGAILWPLVHTYKSRLPANKTPTACQAFAGFCEEKNATSLRFACSLTCGCSDLTSNLTFRTGCQNSCTAVRSNSLQWVDCQDPPAAELRSKKKFTEWVRQSDFLTFVQANRTLLAALGCDALLDLHIAQVFGPGALRHVFCGYDPARVKRLPVKDTDPATLRDFCPVACGCTSFWTSECPETCRLGAGTKAADKGCLGGLCYGNFKSNKAIIVNGEERSCDGVHRGFLSGLFNGTMCTASRGVWETICCEDRAVAACPLDWDMCGAVGGLPNKTIVTPRGELSCANLALMCCAVHTPECMAAKLFCCGA